MVLAAGFLDVTATVIGVILGLAGIALVLLGVIAMGERAFRNGAITAVVGAGLLTGALWLVGAFH